MPSRYAGCGRAARAEKIPADFRIAFEREFIKGRTFAVCMQKGIPTTSVNGVKGDSNGTAHYSIDVFDDGNWKTSAGILDFDQTAVDFLDLGEVMEMADLSWKDNRVDLRMVSVESKKVTRGTLAQVRAARARGHQLQVLLPSRVEEPLPERGRRACGPGHRPGLAPAVLERADGPHLLGPASGRRASRSRREPGRAAPRPAAAPAAAPAPQATPSGRSRRA